MAVPNTNTFTMRDVCNELSVNYPGTSLNELFALANDSGFDPLYKGNKNSLYNFRNYINSAPIYTNNFYKFEIPNRTYGLWIDPEGKHYVCAYRYETGVGGGIGVVDFQTSYDLTSISTVGYDGEGTSYQQAIHVSMSSDGYNMYSIMRDSNIVRYNLLEPFRPLGGKFLVEDVNIRSYGFFINNGGTRAINFSDTQNNNTYTLQSYNLNQAWSLNNITLVDSITGFNGNYKYGVYDKYHYFAEPEGDEVRITQYISTNSHRIDGIIPNQPNDSKVIRNFNGVTDIRGIYPSSNGLYLILNVVKNGIQALWRIDMSGTHIL